MGRPKKKVNYCITIDDVLKERQTKEASRRAKISSSLSLLRQDEREHAEAIKPKNGEFLLDQLVNELEMLVLSGGSKRHIDE